MDTISIERVPQVTEFEESYGIYYTNATGILEAFRLMYLAGKNGEVRSGFHLIYVRLEI
jgi:hypothetical protein